MNPKFNQKVKITGGFYKGIKGIAKEPWNDDASYICIYDELEEQSIRIKVEHKYLAPESSENSLK